MDIRGETKRLIGASGVSLRQLSAKSGVRRQSIMDFLKGGNIHISNLQKLVSALGYALEFRASKPLLEKRLTFSRSKLSKFCKDNGIQYLAVFGSILRKDFGEGSDIDVMIRFKRPVSLFEFADIETRLAKLFKTGHKLDIVTTKSVSPFLIEEISRNSEVLYEEAA
jgi:predicted nucleotidyltransferase